MTIVEGIDWSKYYLGNLCKRNHEWGNSGKSLRNINDQHCLVCNKVARHLRKPPTRIFNIEQRFWSYVERTPTCWDWIGGKNIGGYGVLGVKGKNIPAHRLAWELAYGKIPEGLKILHRCDRPSCVRVDHLWLGTQADNVADMIAKNRKRSLPGVQNPRAKLTEEDVRRIRVLGNEKGVHPEIIALEFGVTRTSISFILQGKTWKHI